MNVMLFGMLRIINYPWQWVSTAIFRRIVNEFRFSLHTMDRPDKRKPLTPEIKGSLVTLYKFGFSIDQIARELGCHVSYYYSTVKMG